MQRSCKLNEAAKVLAKGWAPPVFSTGGFGRLADGRAATINSNFKPPFPTDTPDYSKSHSSGIWHCISTSSNETLLREAFHLARINELLKEPDWTRTPTRKQQCHATRAISTRSKRVGVGYVSKFWTQYIQSENIIGKKSSAYSNCLVTIQNFKMKKER